MLFKRFEVEKCKKYVTPSRWNSCRVDLLHYLELWIACDDYRHLGYSGYLR